MGAFVRQDYVQVILAQMNFRFAPGDALKEMIAFQREFAVFSPDHSLRSSFALINIGPQDDKERRGFYRYLDRLRNVGSNIRRLNGHDALITSLKDNLESKSPAPVFFNYHTAKRGTPIGVKVSVSAPFAFSPVKYQTILLPTISKE